MPTPHPLVAQVMAAVAEQGLSIGMLAQRTGYGYHTLRNWKAGRTCPDLDRFEDLATLLGLRIQLVPADTDPAPPKEGTE